MIINKNADNGAGAVANALRLYFGGDPRVIQDDQRVFIKFQNEGYDPTVKALVFDGEKKSTN